MNFLFSASKYLSLFIAFSFISFTEAAPLNPVNEISFSVIKTAESSGTLEALVVAEGSFFNFRKLVHNAVLVKHPKGDFLWDSGIGRDIEAQMVDFSFIEKQLFSIENIKPARDQLDVHGYPISELKFIIPSHMHWDHASGLEDFNGVPVLVQESSLEEAMAGKPPGFIKSQYDSPEINWQMLTLNDVSYQGFAKSLDIYDDDSAVLVDLSGHSDGHLGLFINLNNGKSYLFIGDATWTLLGVENNKSRPAFTKWLLDVDTDFEENAQVIDQLHKFNVANPNVVIVPAHDELQSQKMPHFPNFIQ